MVCTIIIMMRNMRFESETETSSGNPTDQTHNLINLLYSALSPFFFFTQSTSHHNNIINEILLHINITLTLSQSSLTFLFTFYCHQHIINLCRIYAQHNIPRHKSVIPYTNNIPTIEVFI